MQTDVESIKQKITEIINNMQQVYGVCKELMNLDKIDRFESHINKLKNKIIPDDIDKTENIVICSFLKSNINSNWVMDPTNNKDVYIKKNKNKITT